MDKTEKEQLWAELDAQGEEPTREKLGLGQYGDRRKTYVEEWLRQKDQETQWYETWLGRAALAILVIVAGGALLRLFD